MNKPVSLLAVSTLAFAPIMVEAASILSLDLDPATAGLQSTITVDIGQSFSIDLLLEGIESSTPLQGFEFDLSFDPSMIAATDLMEGGFLQGPSPIVFPPFNTIVVEQDIIAPDVNFAVTAIGPSTSSGSGILASVSFSALALGSGLLELDNVVMVSGIGSDQFDIMLDEINNGTVAVVPLPGAFYLFVTGCASLMGCLSFLGSFGANRGRISNQHSHS